MDITNNSADTRDPIGSVVTIRLRIVTYAQMALEVIFIDNSGRFSYFRK